MTPVDGRIELLRVHAMCEARQIVKAQLKREGAKPSHYAQRELSLMAQQYLHAGHWPVMRDLALARIMATPVLRAQYEAAGERYEALMAKRRRAA
jgi:hypothetical protein